MCNERDRLIAYLYDECDARERDAVREHLDACDECRTEGAGPVGPRGICSRGMRRRTSRLWRPVCRRARRARGGGRCRHGRWRPRPRVVLVAGAGGGVAAHAFMPERAPGAGFE
jgi:anti-sigma factor RsiW